MATSTTYDFAPTIGTLTLNAFARCGVRRTMITQQHMEDAFIEANLLQAAWAADGVVWWTVELVQQLLTAGSPTYLLPRNTVSVLDVYINNGSSNRLIMPFTRTDYASLATPTQQGFPTSFWYDRALEPTLTLWPVPDDAATYTMFYYVYTQPEDAVLRNGGQPAVPYWWLDAYTADLAYRLSRIYAPDREDKRKMDKIEAYATANKQTEPGNLFVSPGLDGYFRS